MTAFDGTQDLVSVFFDSDGREITAGFDDNTWMDLTPEEAFEVAKDLLAAVQVRGRDDLVGGLIIEQAIARGIA